jgi:hypothetical protein
MRVDTLSRKANDDVRAGLFAAYCGAPAVEQSSELVTGRLVGLVDGVGVGVMLGVGGGVELGLGVGVGGVEVPPPPPPPQEAKTAALRASERASARCGVT